MSEGPEAPVVGQLGGHDLVCWDCEAIWIPTWNSRCPKHGTPEEVDRARKMVDAQIASLGKPEANPWLADKKLTDLEKESVELAPVPATGQRKPRVVPNVGASFTPTGNVRVSKRGNKATRRLLRAEAKRAAAEARRQSR